MGLRELHKIPKDTDGALFIRRFPRSLKDNFKAYAYRRGKSIKEAIIELMQDAVSKDLEIQLTVRRGVRTRPE